jgi:hypothetical protein
MKESAIQQQQQQRKENKKKNRIKSYLLKKIVK